MLLYVSTLLLLGSAAVVAATPRAQLGSSIEHAVLDARLTRRQTTTDPTSALTDFQSLLQTAIADSQSTNSCASSNCQPLVQSITACVGSSADDEAVGRCACASDTVNQAERCAQECYTSQASAVASFQTICASGGVEQDTSSVSATGTGSRTSVAEVTGMATNGESVGQASNSAPSNSSPSSSSSPTSSANRSATIGAAVLALAGLTAALTA